MDKYSRLWHEEVQEKKRTARGVYGRTGKRGYVGKMMLTADFLSGKEKREYIKSGKVRTYNMKDVMSYEEFSKFNKEEQRNLLEGWRKLYPNDEIQKGMGIAKNTFYELIDSLGLKKKIGAIKKSEKMKLTDSEINDYKEKMPEYEIYKYIVQEQQTYLFNYHREKYNSPLEFAKAWGVDPNIVYRIGSSIRRKDNVKKMKNEKKSKSSSAAMKIDKKKVDKGTSTKGLVEETAIISPADEVVIPRETKNNKKPEVEEFELPEVEVQPEITETQEEQTLEKTLEAPVLPPTITDNQQEELENFQPEEEPKPLLFNIHEEVDAEGLLRRLNKLSLFIEGENKVYDLKIEIREVEPTPGSKNNNAELLQQISKLVSSISN